MRTRDIYYFVYWLLAALCIVYLLNSASTHLSHVLLASFLVICGVNYCFNFIPDFQDYKESHVKLVSFSNALANHGVKMVYCIDSMPLIAAASHDRILSQAVWLDLSLESGYPLSVFLSDKHTTLFDDAHYDNALICISDSVLNYLESSSFSYRQALFPNIEFCDQFSIRDHTYYFFRPKNRIIAPLDYGIIKF